MIPSGFQCAIIGLIAQLFSSKKSDAVGTIAAIRHRAQRQEYDHDHQGERHRQPATPDSRPHPSRHQGPQCRSRRSPDLRPGHRPLPGRPHLTAKFPDESLLVVDPAGPAVPRGRAKTYALACARHLPAHSPAHLTRLPNVSRVNRAPLRHVLASRRSSRPRGPLYCRPLHRNWA